MGKKKKNKDEETYVITPKGCLWLAIYETLGEHTMSDAKFDDIWNQFKSYMTKAGYIKD